MQNTVYIIGTDGNMLFLSAGNSLNVGSIRGNWAIVNDFWKCWLFQMAIKNIWGFFGDTIFDIIKLNPWANSWYQNQNYIYQMCPTPPNGVTPIRQNSAIWPDCKFNIVAKVRKKEMTCKLWYKWHIDRPQKGTKHCLPSYCHFYKNLKKPSGVHLHPPVFRRCEKAQSSEG